MHAKKEANNIGCFLIFSFVVLNIDLHFDLSVDLYFDLSVDLYFDLNVDLYFDLNVDLNRGFNGFKIFYVI